MTRALIALFGLMLAACGPVATGEPPLQQTSAEACAAQGGSMRPICRMQTVRCVVDYADAGRPCTDGDQCQGDCLAADMDPKATSGVCQANSDPCGCRTAIEDGRAQPGLCVD